MSAQSSEEMAKREEFVYKALRDELSYEANLIVQRTAWFVTGQAFLFSALVLGAPREVNNSVRLAQSVYWPHIPVIAILFSVLTLLSVMSAVKGADVTRQAVREIRERNGSLATAWPVRPEWTRFVGLSVPVIMPFAFLVAWVRLVIER